MSKELAVVGNDDKIINWINQTQAVDPEASIRMLHDIWCASGYSQACNCNPDLLINDKKMLYPKNIL